MTYFKKLGMPKYLQSNFWKLTLFIIVFFASQTKRLTFLFENIKLTSPGQQHFNLSRPHNKIYKLN